MEQKKSGLNRESPLNSSIDNIRAFLLRISKIFAFSISKTYFIYFNNSLYNTPNIKGFIFFTTSLIKDSERESWEEKRNSEREKRYFN